MYNPNPLKVTDLQIYNVTDSREFASSAGHISASNDGTNYTQLTTYTNSTTASGNWHIDLSSNTSFYKYYKWTSTAGGPNMYGTCYMVEIKITATQLTSSLNSIILPMSYSNASYGVGISYLGGNSNTIYISNKTTSCISLSGVDSSISSGCYVTVGY